MPIATLPDGFGETGWDVSQSVFAALLNVPKVTAISWEKGRRKPTGAAWRLLDLVRRKPEILQEA